MSLDASDFPLPDRAALSTARTVLLSRGRFIKPDVLRVEHNGRRFVVKDFAPRRVLLRATFGRWITAREARAWRALAGHPSVPRFLGRIDALALALEYRPGRALSRQLELPAGFVSKLEAAVASMHARGVVHLDLRHQTNVLADERSGAPVLIDFGAALVFRPGSFAHRFLLPLFARIDRHALSKWRTRFPGR